MKGEKDKAQSRADLSHLGPPAMARRLDQVLGSLKAPDVRGTRIAELEAEVARLKALIAQRDEALAAALAVTDRAIARLMFGPAVKLRNVPLTPAQRQKAFRDRKKGKRGAV